jgi:hypothetical protein
MDKFHPDMVNLQHGQVDHSGVTSVHHTAWRETGLSSRSAAVAELCRHRAADRAIDGKDTGM